ncbi:MAG TPA: response regulator [Opitutaceae bacterium]|nr:response regulator [Opitutaceae bacterium]
MPIHAMTPRILIVDDEPINLATMEGFLSADGYELHFAANGREAYDKARELRPDLILLDVMMPEIDGYGVCRLIREDSTISRIPIVIVTALHDQQSRLRGLRAGADDFVTKPCSRDEVRARVRTIASLNRFRAIAEERARFQQLYELSPAAILLVDEQGTILAANRQADTTFGTAADRPLAGTRIGNQFPQRDAIADIIRLTLAEEQPAPRELRRPHGPTEQILQIRSAPVPDGGRRHAMLIFDDVTAEVQAREALQRLNERLEERVRARTRQLEEANTLLLSYASFVSHDLRSPLTVMKGYLDLLHEGVAEVSPGAQTMIGHAHKAAYRMSEMITNILQLAREVHDGRGEAVQPIDPAPVLRHLVSHVRDLAPNPRTTFTIHPLPEVAISGALIDRVFFNLLTNAAKFSADQEKPQVEVGSAPSEDSVILYVRDNGVGFDAREVDRLFREYSRLETAAGADGLGLGLSLVARLVRASGGRIWAESEVGRGATFYVRWPRPDVVPQSVPA